MKLICCQDCKSIKTLDNSYCYQILLINNSNYRAGHFSKNTKGDIIVEYSYNNQRLFFGFHKNGKYYYETESHFIEKNVTEFNINGKLYSGRYESQNIFISTKFDINKTKEYLLSLSSYRTLLEIYDIENDIIYPYITEHILINGIFSYQFALFESTIDNMNTYICIYSHDDGLNEYHISNYFSIKKFSFFENNEHQIDIEFIKSSEKVNVENSRIIQGFLGENNFIYAIFLTKEKYICIQKYNYETLEPEENQTLANDINIENNNGGGQNYQFIIFRTLYLKNDLFSLIYFRTEANINFGILNITANYSYIMQKDLDIDIFPGPKLMNDFIKMDDNRLVFITARNNKINFLFIDLYNNYQFVKMRKYSYISSLYYFDKELSGFNYNDYLMFAITAVKNELGGENYISFFMIFGYANGTDNVIDISTYLYDCDSYDTNNNLFTKLMDNLNIENNIFGYEKINKIKLISIPEQVKIFNSSNFGHQLQNGDILEQNHKPTQNADLIKNEIYYYIDFQYLIKEPEYSTFYSNCDKTLGDTGNFNEYFTPKIFYGRTNTLQFKLCHRFCSSCALLGISDNDQKCLSCLPEYQYDFYNLSKTNCVPEGYYYNNDTNQLVKCDKENFAFILDEKSNKTFCVPYEFSDCTYYDFINGICQFSNYSNIMILNKLIPNLIQTYPKSHGLSLVIKGKENITFHLTTEINEKNFLNNSELNIYGLSVLDLKECENILRNENIINPNDTLIILKVEKETNNVKEKMVQYEIYHPDSKKKINLYKCNSIGLNIPIELSNENKNLYLDLQKQGYDLLNIEDDFYQDICSNYKSQNDTDVLLSDRKNDFYNNNLTCQNDCRYSNYSTKSKYLTCECEINKQNITLDKFKEIFHDSFSSILKNTNYKFMECYKLVFSIKSITKNYGSIILIILSLIHACILIIYIIKGMNPLKLEIIKMIESMKKEENKQQSQTIKKPKKKRKSRKNVQFNPPKKGASRGSVLFFSRGLNTKIGTNIQRNNLGNSRNTVSAQKLKEQLAQLKTEFNQDLPLTNLNVLDDYELNNLSYKEALKMDKRTFLQIYFNMIKKKHLILNAFFSPNDFNINYFKFSKIIFLFATNFAMNVLFFFDESIHKIYINSGIFNLLQQLPQIIYSTIVLVFFEFIISFLTLSEGELHEIKNNIKNQKEDYLDDIAKTLDCFKVKFIIFFVFSFAMLIFYWYFISAFCAVYENTQIIFIEDSFTCFACSLLYSFLKYLFFTACRLISLRCNKDYFICEILYKLGVF